jgi:hypothetical protein
VEQLYTAARNLALLQRVTAARSLHGVDSLKTALMRFPREAIAIRNDNSATA